MQTMTYRNKPDPATERGLSFQGPMRLSDLVYGPWAILPSHLLELQAIYETHLRGEKIDIKAIEARLGRPLANEQQGYQVINGVAVLPVQGAISPKANLMTQISGGASAQMLTRDLLAAGSDSSVKSIILSVDSPGGSVLGTPEFAAAARRVADSKPLVTHSDGAMASAAYWIGSAANAMFISGPTVQVGSIGVVGTHRDTSGADAKAGIKTTEITAGKYKRIASSTEPLTAEGRATLQAQVDYLYELFVDAVAAHRGVSVDAVLEHMADGRVFIGQQAIDAGLVDGVSTIDALIEQMATNPAAFAARRPAQVKSKRPAKSSKGAGAAQAEDEGNTAALATTSTPPVERIDTMTEATNPVTLESFQRDHTAVYAQATAAGAAAERERIKGVREQLIPGHEALIETLAMDGKTTPGEAAMAVNAAYRQQAAAAAKAHADDAPPAVKAAAAPADVPSDTERDANVAKAEAHARETGCDIVEAMEKFGVR